MPKITTVTQAIRKLTTTAIMQRYPTANAACRRRMPIVLRLVTDDAKPADRRIKMAFVWLIILSVGLLQGSFFVSSFQALFPRRRRNTRAYKVVKVLQTAPILLMMASEIWFFFMVFLPVEVDHPYSSLKGLLYILISCYIWINMVFNYLAAAIVSPGYPETRQNLERDPPEELIDLGLKPEFCPKCDKLRVKGTHHCSTCDSCVMLMSHHCPFTNNCIGRDNYVYFYLFLLYCWIGLVWSAFCSYSPFMACMMQSADHLELYPASRSRLCVDLGDYAVMFLVVVLMLLFVVFVFLFHTLLLVTDMVMIDFLRVCHKLTSPGQLGRGLLGRCWRKEKRLFRRLVWYKRSKWWKFLLPYFNQEDEFSDDDGFIV